MKKLYMVTFKVPPSLPENPNGLQRQYIVAAQSLERALLSAEFVEHSPENGERAVATSATEMPLQPNQMFIVAEDLLDTESPF